MKAPSLLITFSLLLSGCLTYALYGIPIDLDLMVVDAETGAPIPNANCVLMNPEETATLEELGDTDAAGLLHAQTTRMQCREESMGRQYPHPPKWTFVLKLSHANYQDTTLVLESVEGNVVHRGTITMIPK